MSKRIIINVLALVTVLAGGTSLASAQIGDDSDPINVGVAASCTYDTCMKYCNNGSNFEYCHDKCNRDCTATL